MAEGRKIRLTIVGTQSLPDTQREGAEAPVTTRMQTEALYYQKGDSHYLFYEEQPEGFPAPMKTRLKFRQGYLELFRQGTLGCRMTFESGSVHRTEYPTPYGKLLMDIVTTAVQLEQRETGDGSECPFVTVEYRLENEGQLMGNYQLRLESED